MSKVMQWSWDEVPKKKLITLSTNLKITLSAKKAAKAKIMNVQNVELCSIDEYNVDEVIDMELEAPNDTTRTH